jgi:endonuclease/exonuclease/phosphatase family metal-dependent hydrolase
MTRTNVDSSLAPERRLRIMTYNVHSCRGADGQPDPTRIAEVIARHEPDIVGLQELDVGRSRTGGIDQAQAIATHLRMKSHFHPALSMAEEKYGDAVLTTLPARLRKAAGLPSIGEPRGAIWLTVHLDGTNIQIFNTHLGLWRRERMRQVQSLLGPAWLGHPDVAGQPVIFMGDFNSVPSSAPYKLLARGMSEVQSSASPRPRATFPARFPMLRIDHIFLRGVTALEAHVIGDRMARSASDHLPVLATVSVPVSPQRNGTGASRMAARSRG